MKFFLTTLLLVSTTICFATEKKTINLDMKLSIDGKLVSMPKVVSLLGETASISSTSENGDGLVIEVTPTLQNKNKVFMKFVVSKLEKGKKTILSNPKIISILGQQAQITKKSTDGPTKSMSLAVTATL